MFWTVLIVVIIIYSANTALAMRQMKRFSTSYSSLRRRGKVAIGKQKNALTSGSIAALQDPGCSRGLNPPVSRSDLVM